MLVSARPGPGTASRFRLAAAAVVVLLGALLAASFTVQANPGTGSSAAASTTWAPVASAALRPGIRMETNGAQCTSNFVFTDAAGNVYFGYAAHCAALGSSSDTDGCTTPTLKLGTPVLFTRGGNLFRPATLVGKGVLAYSSWRTMQQLKARGVKVPQARCALNDFALVRVVNADKRKVNPTVPVWGGPTALQSVSVPVGQTVYTVANSSSRGGDGFGFAKTSTIAARLGGGLGYQIKGNPGIPGDSGSGFMDRLGRPIGVLSTLEVSLGFGTPITNAIGDLPQEVRWAALYSGIRGLKLAPGTVRFRAGS